MSLVFEVIRGPGQGSVFAIRDGATIGRKGTTIVLDDSNVSGKHARVENRLGLLFLVDAGSANGLKSQGKRVKEILLKPGAVVKLGSTSLRVHDAAEPGFEAKPVAKPDRELDWTERLLTAVERLKTALHEKSDDFALTMRPFSPPLELKFERGPQTGQSWLIGFGPRSVGARSVDLKVLEPESPDVCFSIRPEGGGVLFRTDHPDVVKLNGASHDVETLKNGDTIEILGTRIAVVIEAE